MRTVKYSELSRAMHDFTKQIDTLDECIEVGLVFVDAPHVIEQGGVGIPDQSDDKQQMPCGGSDLFRQRFEL